MSRQSPTHLKHKPIYEIKDYDRMDGEYRNDSDVYALSVGKAQWDDTDFIPSVKVWRKKKNRWSRQSEETTLTRALDMATLVIQVLDKTYNGNNFRGETTVFGEIKVETIPGQVDLQRQLVTRLNQSKKTIDAHVQLLYRAIQQYMK